MGPIKFMRSKLILLALSIIFFAGFLRGFFLFSLGVLLGYMIWGNP